MARAKHTATKHSNGSRAERARARAKGGRLAHVHIVRPRIGPQDVDLKAVRKALRAYFRTNPKAIE